MTMNLYGIVGAGGFGREVIPLAQIMLKRLSPSINFELVFVDQHKESAIVNQYPVMTLEEFCNHKASNKFFNVAIAGHINRKKMVDVMLANGAKPFRINADNYVELDNNVIDDGAIFCPFTTVTSNSKIGKYFHANVYSYIAHDCIIGDYVTFAPNVHCNGNIIIEDNVYVGTGVIIKQGTLENPTIIGKNAILGMGAVVTKSVPPDVTMIGNPARIFNPHERKVSTSATVLQDS